MEKPIETIADCSGTSAGPIADLNRKSQIANRKLIVVAVCVLSCIAGVAYTKADRTATLLSATAIDTETGAPWHGLPARERDPKRHLSRLGTQTHGQDGHATGMAVPPMLAIVPDSATSPAPNKTAADLHSEPNGEQTSPPPRLAPLLPSEEGKGAGAGEWRTVRMRVTAYCPCPKCCGQYSDGVTANGHRIRPGEAFVAADRRYRFGTEMVIPGYNDGQPVKVLDRGGAIRGKKLDVFFHSHQEALEWGVKHLDVQVRSN